MVEATKLFADAGFKATSVQNIADAVGIGKTLVLYHYPSKDLLRAAVVDQVAALWMEMLPAFAGLGAADPAAALAPAIQALELRPWLSRFVMRELLDRESGFAAELRERLVPSASSAGGRAWDPEVVAEWVFAALSLLAVLAVFEPGKDGAGGIELRGRVLAVAVRSAASAVR